MRIGILENFISFANIAKASPVQGEVAFSQENDGGVVTI